MFSLRTTVKMVLVELTFLLLVDSELLAKLLLTVISLLSEQLCNVVMSSLVVVHVCDGARTTT